MGGIFSDSSANDMTSRNTGAATAAAGVTEDRVVEHHQDDQLRVVGGCEPDERGGVPAVAAARRDRLAARFRSCRRPGSQGCERRARCPGRWSRLRACSRPARRSTSLTTRVCVGAGTGLIVPSACTKPFDQTRCHPHAAVRDRRVHGGDLERIHRQTLTERHRVALSRRPVAGRRRECRGSRRGNSDQTTDRVRMPAGTNRAGSTPTFSDASIVPMLLDSASTPASVRCRSPCDSRVVENLAGTDQASVGRRSARSASARRCRSPPPS